MQGFQRRQSGDRYIVETFGSESHYSCGFRDCLCYWRRWPGFLDSYWFYGYYSLLFKRASHKVPSGRSILLLMSHNTDTKRTEAISSQPWNVAIKSGIQLRLPERAKPSALIIWYCFRLNHTCLQDKFCTLWCVRSTMWNFVVIGR